MIRALAALALVASPAAAQKVRVTPYPAYTPAYDPQGTDERGLWMEADEAERGLRDSAFVVRDEALGGYLREVLCRTVGQDRCAGARMYVVRMPMFNAMMRPNGAMVIWTGLLLRVRSEAELAAVLAHEFAHFEKRHSLKGFARARTASDWMTWIGLAGAAAGTGVANINLMLLGSVFEYTRAQEREADVVAATYLAASPYRVAPFAEVWTRMMEEADASALARGRKPHSYDRVNFFDSHPTHLDRATYLAALAKDEPTGGIDGGEGFSSALAPMLPSLLGDQVKLNDFGGSEYLLTRLAAGGWTAPLLLARGELYRLRGAPRDLVTAAGYYREATLLPDVSPEAWRGLGLCLLRSGQAGDGQVALAEYLRRKPDATDAAMIAALLPSAIGGK